MRLGKPDKLFPLKYHGLEAVVPGFPFPLGSAGMRFELSNSTSARLSRRLQLQMLGFVALIAMLLIVFNAFQPPQKPTRSGAAELPGSPDRSISQLDETQSLRDGEFLSPPEDAERASDPDPAFQNPPLDDGNEKVPADDGMEQKLARLQTQFDKAALRRVKDNTFGIRREEASAYYRLLDHAQKVSPTELERAGATDVLYINLMTESQRYRGEPVTIQGDLWRLYEFQAGPNERGFKTLYEAWIFTADSDKHPYRVICTSLPRGLHPGDNLRESVRVTGYFFKREGYASNGGMHVAPTLLAHRIMPFQSAHSSPSLQAIVPQLGGLASAVGLAFLVTVVSLSISDRRTARASMLRELNAARPSFEGLDVEPTLSVHESLRQLADREWQAMADSTNPTHEDVSAALHARDQVRPEERPETLATESEETAAERRRSEARLVKDWTVQQNGPHFAVPPPHPETVEESEDSAADGPQEPLVLGNGLSKLAAWENEIRQFSPPEETQDEDLTEEQRAAREELERDQKARERELNDRLLQQRADLERERKTG